MVGVIFTGGIVANRPFKSLSDKYNETLREIGVAGAPQSTQAFNEQVSSILKKLINFTKTNEITEQHILQIDSNITQGGWTAEIQALRNNYAILHQRYTKLSNAEKSINRIEGIAHRRALFYRILTTLGIGFSVMLVYYVAECLGISMPLKVSA